MSDDPHPKASTQEMLLGADAQMLAIRRALEQQPDLAFTKLDGTRVPAAEALEVAESDLAFARSLAPQIEAIVRTMEKDEGFVEEVRRMEQDASKD